MAIIVVVSIVLAIVCVIAFIAGQDLVRIYFITDEEVVSGGIVEFIAVVIR